MTWIASYPRSGNTFLRMLLMRVFEIKSTSLYAGEESEFGKAQGLIDIIGHYENKRLHKKKLSRKCDEYIKTHDKPADDSPAIYIVRDGRAATISYYHYLRDIEHRNVSFEDLISGKVWPGTWSDHYRAWDPERRSRTLFVRYEDLKDRTREVCERLSQFVGIPLKREFDIEFAQLHALHPNFFRSGGKENSYEEIEPYFDLFARHNRRMMEKLGYL